MSPALTHSPSNSSGHREMGSLGPSRNTRPRSGDLRVSCGPGPPPTPGALLFRCTKDCCLDPCIVGHTHTHTTRPPPPPHSSGNSCCQQPSHPIRPQGQRPGGAHEPSAALQDGQPLVPASTTMDPLPGTRGNTAETLQLFMCSCPHRAWVAAGATL